jgi:hypothetical protein
MSQLPKPTHVAEEARACARRWLEDLKDADFVSNLIGARLPPTLHPGAGEIFARQIIKARAMSGAEGMMRIIELARAGWDEADAALRELYVDFRHHRQDPPPELVTYSMEVLPRPYRRSRGRRKSRNFLQDMMFGLLIAELAHKFGLHPTRKIDAHRDSVCDILVMAVREAKWLKRSFDYKTAERLFYLWGIGWAQDLARGDPKI